MGQALLTRHTKQLTWNEHTSRVKISNARLCEITKPPPIKEVCYKQQLKYTGHICRMDSSELLKQTLFDIRSMSPVMWKRFENLLEVDAQQIRRNIKSQSDLALLLNKAMSGQLYPRIQVIKVQKSMMMMMMMILMDTAYLRQWIIANMR